MTSYINCRVSQRERAPSSRLPWWKSVTVEQALRERADASGWNGEEGETIREKKACKCKRKESSWDWFVVLSAPVPPLRACFWPCVTGPKGRAWAPPPRGTARSAVCLRLGRWIHRWWSSPTTDLTSLSACHRFVLEGISAGAVETLRMQACGMMGTWGIQSKTACVHEHTGAPHSRVLHLPL